MYKVKKYESFVNEGIIPDSIKRIFSFPKDADSIAVQILKKLNNGEFDIDSVKITSEQYGVKGRCKLNDNIKICVSMEGYRHSTLTLRVNDDDVTDIISPYLIKDIYNKLEKIENNRSKIVRDKRERDRLDGLKKKYPTYYDDGTSYSGDHFW